MNKKCINTIELFYKKKLDEEKSFLKNFEILFIIIIYTQILCKIKKNTFFKNVFFSLNYRLNLKIHFCLKILVIIIHGKL
jgi:hypothetical protein